MVVMNTRTNVSVAATKPRPSADPRARVALLQVGERPAVAGVDVLERGQREARAARCSRCPGAAGRGRRRRAGRPRSSPDRCPRRTRRGWGGPWRGGGGPRCAARSRWRAGSRRRWRICAGCCSNWMANTRRAWGRGSAAMRGAAPVRAAAACGGRRRSGGGDQGRHSAPPAARNLLIGGGRLTLDRPRRTICSHSARSVAMRPNKAIDSQHSDVRANAGGDHRRRSGRVCCSDS